MKISSLAVLAAGALATACASSSPEDAWTVAQAESIRSVRGTMVRVRECRGIGSPQHDGGAPRYMRFACVAGARRAAESYDTVAVLFDLEPLEPYLGPDSDRRLRNVRFLGGPGIP